MLNRRDKCHQFQPARRGLEFNAVAGRAYSILWRDFVESGAWIKLTDVPSAGATQPVQLIDDTLGSRSQRNYRIVTPPVP